jgi:hypothetical protein
MVQSAMQRTFWPSSSVAQVAQATCWSRRDLINRSTCWFRVLPRALRGDLLGAAEILANAGRALDRWHGLPLSGALGILGLTLRNELVAGSGVVYLTGLIPPGSAPSDDVLRWAYLLLGVEIGAPMGPRGSLVEIMGRCHGAAGRAESAASPETRFHTDSDGGQTPDVVGTLCLNPASSGGECQVASATLAHELLKARCHDLLSELYEPFRRDADASDQGPATAAAATGLPVFATDGQNLTFNYMRHRIESAHERAGVPLSARQAAALDHLDEALGDPLAHVQLHMKRGEVLLVNNRHIAHNRRPFVDHEDPDRRRHMVRMWLSLPSRLS